MSFASLGSSFKVVNITRDQWLMVVFIASLAATAGLPLGVL